MGDGENGDQGGSADLVGGGGDGGAGGGNGGGNGDGSNGGGGGGGDGGGDGGQDPAFYGLLSAEGGDADNPSNRDWAKAAGLKDPDHAIKLLRDNIKAVRDSGRVKVPGENATPEEKTAFARAIGVPEKPDGYAVPVIPNGKFDPNQAEGPANPKNIPLDTTLIGKLAESAHKHGAPKGAFEGLVKDFIALQLDEAATIDAEQKSKADAQLKEWGKDKDAKLAAVDKAAHSLALTRADMQGLRTSLGADRALALLARLGEGMTEDTLITGGRGRFGVTPAEAQTELDKLNSDPEHMKLVNAKDAATLARRQRLIDTIAADRLAKSS